jgi:hypothetical protein
MDLKAGIVTCQKLGCMAGSLEKLKPKKGYFKIAISKCLNLKRYQQVTVTRGSLGQQSARAYNSNNCHSGLHQDSTLTVCRL